MNVLGIGTEITECLRIARMIERYGEQFLDRVFTPREIRYCRARKQATQHFTGHWSAKEAILKAIGAGWGRGVTWHDVEILNTPGEKPRVVLRGGAREAARQQGIDRVLISLAHCHTHATAQAMALGPGE